MRSKLAALLLVAGCGPSAGTDEACTREGIVTSGALATGLYPEECSPCDLEASYVLITLETTCEAGVEWWGSFRFIHHTTAVNLATQEEFSFENPLGEPGESLWHVTPDEPLTQPGPRTDQIVTEPGDYSFRVELLQDLMAVDFEGSVE
jgi:hypothetical protein